MRKSAILKGKMNFSCGFESRILHCIKLVFMRGFNLHAVFRAARRLKPRIDFYYLKYTSVSAFPRRDGFSFIFT